MIPQATPVSNPVTWLGIDVAKEDFQAALARPGLKWPATPLRDLPVKRFARTRAGVAALVAWLAEIAPHEITEGPVGVVMEATGKYSVELGVWIAAQERDLRPAIINPFQTSSYIKSMNVRSKTDALEARALAFYGVERTPAPYEPMTKHQRLLRELVRHRATLVEQKIAHTNRKGERSESPFVRKAQERITKMLTREIAKTEKAMRELVAKHEELQQDVALLSSIYGVAFVTAATVLGELGDLRRFDKARQLSAFVGLNPHQRQSGSSIHKPAHLSKKGNRRVRKALYMAALTAIQDKGSMQATFEHLRAQGKSKMVAIGAIMRKLMVLMRAILISEQPYDPMWKTQPKCALGGPSVC